MTPVSSSTYYCCIVQSVDAALANQNLPRVASRGREVDPPPTLYRYRIIARVDTLTTSRAVQGQYLLLLRRRIVPGYLVT